VSYRPLNILAASAAAFGVAAAANAQAPAATAPAPKPIARTAIIAEINANYKAVDTNNDGAVTVAEISAAQTRAQQSGQALFVKRRSEVFTRLDTNKDGQLSAAEFNAGSPVPQPRRADPAQLLGQMDGNKDQKVTATEFGATTLANFDRVDLNRDGSVSVDEQQKAMAANR